jgi:CBS domain-containing protein
MRVPFTGVVFALELTHDVNALLPLLVGAVVADFVTVFALKRSILTQKVARRGVHVAREYSVDTLELISVASVVHRDVQLVPASMSMPELIDKFNSTEGKVYAYPVVDGVGDLLGIITRSDILSYMSKNGDGDASVREYAHTSMPVTYTDEPVRTAADKMAQYELEALVVVDPVDPQRVIGLISREDLFRARTLWFAEEKERERMIEFPKDHVTNIITRIKARLNRRKTLRKTSKEV